MKVTLFTPTVIQKKKIFFAFFSLQYFLLIGNKGRKHLFIEWGGGGVFKYSIDFVKNLDCRFLTDFYIL